MRSSCAVDAVRSLGCPCLWQQAEVESGLGVQQVHLSWRDMCEVDQVCCLLLRRLLAAACAGGYVCATTSAGAASRPTSVTINGVQCTVTSPAPLVG